MPHDAGSTQAKLLIVDDKAANLDLLREMLAPPGHRIYFATSGPKALEIATSVLPDLVLLDVMMPGMDGFETCRRFKQDKALREIPVIFVTARTDVEDLARGFEAGAVDYITKPVKQPEVHARVATHLQIQGLIAQQRAHLAALEQARGELEALNDAKDKFLSNLGREVSISLAQIADASATLRASATSPDTPGSEIGQQLAEVNRSAEDVLQLLETILEWPRLQTGQKLDLLSMIHTDYPQGTRADDALFISANLVVLVVIETTDVQIHPFEEVDEAFAAAESCDLMLVVGTSAVVYPVAHLPELARRGGPAGHRVEAPMDKNTQFGIVEPVRHRGTRRQATPEVGAGWPGPADRPVRRHRTAASG